MANEPTGSHHATDALTAVTANYLQAVDNGFTPNREALLAHFPDLADQLRDFFRTQDEVERLARPLRDVRHPPRPSEVSTIGASPSAAPATTPPQKTAARSLPANFGDYAILGEIARGGMGVVYRARQASASREVALKMVLHGGHTTDAERQRFRQEAEAAANLDHPNIVPIYEVGEHEGQPFYSMKLVEGNSLAHDLPHFQRNPRAAAELLATVARAVHHAHQRGILHRDLKPGNILLDRARQPHVTDFGLAKRLEGDSGLTQSGAIVGTPEYMAPEQARGQKGLTVAADVYALGAILYALLTGRPPFKGEHILETLRQAMDTEATPPRLHNPQVNRDLEVICLKCLEKDAGKRYGSAEALAQDLERWLAGEPIQARPVSTATRLVKWCRRRPAVAALAGVLLLVTVGAFAVVMWLWQAEASQRREAESARNGEAQQRGHAETARDDATRSLYYSRVAHAYAEWQRGRGNSAEDLLRQCPAEKIGWEWHFVKYLNRQDEATFHGGKVETAVIAMSPDGRFFAMTEPSGRGVQLRDTTTLRVQRALAVQRNVT
jgi:hypothetical protein